MLEWDHKKMDKLNLYGIYLVNYRNHLLRIVRLCLELVIMKNIMIMLHIMQDMISLKYITDRLIYGFLSIMDKFMLYIFHHNTHMKKEVNNMLSYNKICVKHMKIQIQNG